MISWCIDTYHKLIKKKNKYKFIHNIVLERKEKKNNTENVYAQRYYIIRNVREFRYHFFTPSMTLLLYYVCAHNFSCKQVTYLGFQKANKDVVVK